MFFLVFFEFCSFDVHQFDLPVEVILDGFVLPDLFFQVAFFLVDGLFLLSDAVLRIVDFFVFFQKLPVVGRLLFYNAFLGFQFFFLADGFGSHFSFPDDSLGLRFSLFYFNPGIFCKDELTRYKSQYEGSRSDDDGKYIRIHESCCLKVAQCYSFCSLS